MSKQKTTSVPLTKIILQTLSRSKTGLVNSFETQYTYLKKLKQIKRADFTRAVWRMQKQKLLRVVKKGNNKSLMLTQEGQLLILISKAKNIAVKAWDGIWRLIIFDIPEDFRDKRDQLRWLLKRNGFVKLQASVFISPYPLNREAIKYLKETKLISFIRILRVDEMDDDEDLKKKFNLI